MLCQPQKEQPAWIWAVISLCTCCEDLFSGCLLLRTACLLHRGLLPLCIQGTLTTPVIYWSWLSHWASAFSCSSPEGSQRDSPCWALPVWGLETLLQTDSGLKTEYCALGWGFVASSSSRVAREGPGVLCTRRAHCFRGAEPHSAALSLYCCPLAHQPSTGCSLWGGCGVSCL